MAKILQVRSTGDYIRYLGGEEQHPLVGIVDYAALSPIRHSLNNYSVYGVFMHEHLSVDLQYGCGKYDYQNGGTVICVAPGQIGGKEDNGERMHLDGWALLFHPDMLHGTYLKTIMPMRGSLSKDCPPWLIAPAVSACQPDISGIW